MKKIDSSRLAVFPIITLTTLLQFCAPTASKTALSGGYEEDLSIYRESINQPIENENTTAVETYTESVEAADVEPTHDLKMELDSVTNIIIQSRQDVVYVDGFTIQLYSGNDRDQANEVRRNAYDTFADFKPDVSYDQPNYKVRVGKYFTRLEANEDYNLLKEHFSRAVLVPTKIKIDEE